MLCAFAICLWSVTAVDADTVKADGQGYRIWGINAPERGSEGFVSGKAAMAHTLAGAKGLLCFRRGPKSYGRPVVQCFLTGGELGGADLACLMVAEGWAEDWPKYSGGVYGQCERRRG